MLTFTLAALTAHHHLRNNKTKATNDPSSSSSSSLVLSLVQKLTHDIPLYILTNHRSTIVVLFGLPLSLLWDTLLKLRSYYIHKVHSAPHLHEQRVQSIVHQVQNRSNPNSPLCTARPGWMSVSLSYRNYKQKWNAIPMPLYDILDVDYEHQIVHVEPFVSIGQLTHTLNPKGYTLPVVPEMDDLTIGGLINGTGIESSSHVYGLFHEIITELEICLGDGTVVIATKDNEYSDLFHAVPWSYGTLGLLLSAKLKMIPCKEFVKLTYLPFGEKEEYIHCLRSLSGEFDTCSGKNGSDERSSSSSGNPNSSHSGTSSSSSKEKSVQPQQHVDGIAEEKKNDDSTTSCTNTNDVKTPPMFVEGLTYSTNEAVIMKGEFISKKDIPKNGTINRLSLWFKPWFYKHVQNKLAYKDYHKNTHNHNPEIYEQNLVEYIPLRDYYHRHTQSLFWEMELMIPIGNHPLFRYLLGWLMPPKVSFLKISQTEMTRQLVERTHVAQDFLVPTRKMSDFLTVCDEKFDYIYPLWLCLHNHTSMPGSILRDPLTKKDEMYIDIGVYGLPKCVHEKREEEFDMKRSMREVAEELVKMNGFQMLYADVFNTREEFEKMFDHEGYRMIRKKYKADTGCFKEVYDKMSVIL